MKWITYCFLLISIAFAAIVVYVIVVNAIDYTIEDASYYRELLLKYMKYFFFYIVLTILYLMASIAEYYNRTYCKA